MAGRRDRRRYGVRALDVRRGGLGAQVAPAIPTIKDVDVWIRVNGTDIANSNSIQSLTDTDEREVMVCKRVVQLQAGDYIEMMFAVNDAAVVLNSFVADAVSPVTPSVVLNITQVK